jgi:hypothetical protein
MKIYTRFILLCLFVAGLSVSACRTYQDADEVSPDTTTTGTVTNNNQITISFPRTSISIGTTDSVVATFFDGGSQTFHKKGSRGGSFYTIPLTGMHTGNWQATIKVYTAKPADDDARMYRYSATVNVTNSSSIVGPTGSRSDVWKPNLFLRNTDYGVRLAIAELPTDPYYELTLPQNLINYRNVYIDRYIYRTIDNADVVVAYGNVVLKAADHKGVTVNTTNFAAMANAMADQTWTSADINLQLYNDSGNDYRILFQRTVTNK